MHATIAHLPDVSRLSRGVYKLRGHMCGKRAYVAVTSDCDVLHGCMFLATDQEPDATVVRWLRGELDRTDPARPGHLRLLPRVVSPAIDGPSPAHPAMIEGEEDIAAQLRHAIAESQELRVQAGVGSLDAAPDIAARLTSLLAETA